MAIIEKTQQIYNQLSILLFQLHKICVSTLAQLPHQIEKIVVGENKIGLFAGGLIEEINSNDLVGVTTLKTSWFRHQTNLKSVTIPDTISDTPSGIFEGCTNIESIEFPIGYTRYLAELFTTSFSKWYEQEKYIPPSLKNVKVFGTLIKDSMFYRCMDINNIIISNGVTQINQYAFYECEKLENIEIPNSITIIDFYAFGYCKSLKNITIPNNVITIGNNAFLGCESLTDIYLNPTTPPSLGLTGSIPSTTTIHVPIGSGEAYKSATNWSYHSDRIVEDIEI